MNPPPLVQRGGGRGGSSGRAGPQGAGVAAPVGAEPPRNVGTAGGAPPLRVPAPLFTSRACVSGPPCLVHGGEGSGGAQVVGPDQQDPLLLCPDIVPAPSPTRPPARQPPPSPPTELSHSHTPPPFSNENPGLLFSLSRGGHAPPGPRLRAADAPPGGLRPPPPLPIAPPPEPQGPGSSRSSRGAQGYQWFAAGFF